MGSEEPGFLLFGIICKKEERRCPVPGLHQVQPVIFISVGCLFRSGIIYALSLEVVPQVWLPLSSLARWRSTH